MTLLSEIASIQTGPFGSQLHKRDYVTNGRPIVTVEHLGERAFTRQNLPLVSDFDADRLEKYQMKCGDIIFSRVGSVDRCSLADQGNEGWLFSGRCLRIRPEKTIDPEFLYYYLSSKAIKNFVRNIAVGATMPSINTSLMGEIPVPDTPLNEQRSIACIMSSLDHKIQANTRLNGYLEEQCEAIANHEKGCAVELASLCDLVKDKADYSEANFDTYVSTESLLPGKKGRRTPSSLPQTGIVTVYKPGDILVSNIRPYFKKIWYANRAGTCSGDVLVFRAKQLEQSGYLYSCMRSDAFFDHVMKGAKGTKMPRGDKKQMLTYKVAGNPSKATVDFIESALNQASSLSREKHHLAALRDALLPKLMTGEIDVSKIDPTQLNSHLA